MKRITSFQQAIEYLNHLGFAGSGNIANRQMNLCDVADRLHAAAGCALGQHEYKVTYHRYVSPEGFTYPYLGSFTVVGPKGKSTITPSK